jgi:hypothetical protein
MTHNTHNPTNGILKKEEQEERERERERERHERVREKSASSGRRRWEFGTMRDDTL